MDSFEFRVGFGKLGKQIEQDQPLLIHCERLLADFPFFVVPGKKEMSSNNGLSTPSRP